MRFGSGIEIETVGGNAADARTSELSTARSAKSWVEAQRVADTVRADGEPISIEEFLTETHHQYYGRPWLLGRFFFQHLVERGVKPSDRVLDLGCGSGRVGIWLIPYLQPAHYFGIDVHLRSLVAFAEYESLLHDLVPKAPRLLLDDDFNIGHFGTEFDVMLDFSVTWGLPLERLKQAYARAQKYLRPGGRVFYVGKLRLSKEEFATLGYDLTRQESVTYPVSLSEKPVSGVRKWRLRKREPEIARRVSDEWHELTRR